MNREILFRGKRVDNGKWVYGFYGEFHNRPIHDAPNSCQIFELREDAYLCGSAIGGIWHEVIPSTIGQYTGLIDKNGTRIFEGDILKQKRYGMSEAPFSVDWNAEGAGWYFVDVDGHTDELWQSICNSCTVVGNIHDNPDMLTGEGEG